MEFSTKLLHNGNEIDEKTGALSIPIYQASTFHQNDVDAGQEYDYSRSGNPTRKALEDSMAILEGGSNGYAFASGMAATSSVLAIFSAGDHLIVCEDVYGGTYRAVSTIFSRFGIEYTFVDASDSENIKAAIKPNTKGIFIETPSNPLLKITDIRKTVEIAKGIGALTILDGTFMSPYLQKPMELGVDIVIHSATKFIGGHSDVIAGIVVTKDAEIGRRVYRIQNGFGAVLGPMDSWLLLRGLKTLSARMDVQQKSAEKLAKWLSEQPEIEKVYYPSLEGHEGKEIHQSQSLGGGAVLSFKTKTVETAAQFMKQVKLAAVAVSLGGVETIVSYPVKMSHAAMPKEFREKLGVTPNLIRVSVGLEDADDLIEDFGKALENK